MINVNLTKNGSFWDFKGKLDFVDQWFLMNTPVPIVAIITIYILFVLKIGPEYIKTRPPYSLKNVMVLYNTVQVFISIYLFYLTGRLLLSNGFVSKTCILEKEETRHKLPTTVYYFFLAKVSELLDTIFFVLRKKDSQITFLHVYHHTIMVFATWLILKYEPNYPIIFIGNINSFVHVIMYAYYGLSSFPSLAKYLWWKKYITRLQLVQFALILIHFVMTYTTSECTPSYPLCLTITLNTSLFIFLFGKFYIESYSKKDNIKVVSTVIQAGARKVKNKYTMDNADNVYSTIDKTTINNDESLLNRKKIMTGN